MRRLSLTPAALALAAIAGACGGKAGAPDAAPDACGAPLVETGHAGLDAYLAWLEAQLPPDRVPGAAVALIEDGQIRHLATLGVRRAGACEPVTTGTLFRLGAVTTTITAAALLSAADDGALSLDEPVIGPVPELAVASGDATAITAHHLLTFSSGYPPGGADDCADADPAELAAWWARTTDRHLWFSPGSMMSWEHLGHGLAGLALERRSGGDTFAEAVDARIFSPLGMTATFSLGEAASRELAAGHRLGAPVAAADCGALHPTDQLYASIDDLARFVQMLTTGGGGVLSADAVAAMLSPQGPDTWSDAARSYGFVLLPWTPDATVAYNNAWDAYGASVLILPDRSAAIVQLVNGHKPIYQYDLAALELVFDLAIVPRQTATDPATWGEYAGTYVDPLGVGDGPRTVEITARGVALTASVDGEPGTLTPAHWAPGADAALADMFTLAYAGRTVSIRFWRDDDGVPVAIGSEAGAFGPPAFRQ